jgi:hypothetical protein
MRRPVIVTLLIVLASSPSASQSTPSVEVGRYRQVHVLAPSSSDSLRIATVGLIAPVDASGDWSWRGIESSFVEVWSLGAEEVRPEARVELSFNPIRQFSWTQRPTWRVIAPGKLLLLVYVGPGSQPRVHVVDMRTGRTLADHVPGDEIYDARTVGDSAELLVRQGTTVARVVVSTETGGFTLRSTPLTTTVAGVALDSVSAATFAVAATSRCEPTGVAWILGLAKGDEELECTPWLVSVPADPAAPSSAFQVDVRALQADDDSVYLAAASAAGQSWIAVGQQAFQSGHGLVTMFTRAADAEPKQMWSAVGPDTFAATDWGHDLCFVPDADDDDVPDLVVPGPWDLGGTSRIDLVSTSTGTGIACWSPGMAVGFTAELTPDGKSIVVGGTTQQHYPETFSGLGVVHVLDARTLERSSSTSESRRAGLRRSGPSGTGRTPK